MYIKDEVARRRDVYIYRHRFIGQPRLHATIVKMQASQCHCHMTTDYNCEVCIIYTKTCDFRSRWRKNLCISAFRVR